MSELDKLRTVFKLKEVCRNIPVQSRKESPAEHSWCCMVLADYFLQKIEVDRSKVMDLLLYHDLVEIESGDTYFMDEESVKKQKKREEEGFKALHKKLPPELLEKYIKLHNEFQEKKTIEAKFAHAIDKLEPVIHMLDYKEEEWKNGELTEKYLREKKEKSFEPFPEIASFFEDIMSYLKENKYI